MLEFVTLAVDAQRLDEPWIRRAAENLCDLFRMTRDVPLECGALYHAAHALVLYRTRVYGPRRYGVPADAAQENAASKQGASGPAGNDTTSDPSSSSGHHADNPQ